MKIKILFFVLLSLPLSGMAQQATSDLIIKMNGDSLRGTVTHVGPVEITYTYPNETVTYSVSKNVTQQVQFSNGRIEKINDPIVINGEEDWEKVKIAVLPAEVSGLRHVGRVYVVGQPAMGRSLAKKEQIALDKVKKEAASKGCPIAFVESRNVDDDNRLILTVAIFNF